MMDAPDQTGKGSGLVTAYDYAVTFRQRKHALDATESAEELRKRFCLTTPEAGRDGAEVIQDLIAAAEPGLVANTDPNFFAWVMGGSDTTGVAADWLTSIWGQNSAIFQTSPAAAIAEEAVAAWLLDMLRLPSESSVGLVTGATMAGFVCLAAARGAVLSRAGFDVEKTGLQGASLIHIFVCDDSHVSNYAALRYLGFGENNLVRVPADDQGAMDAIALGQAIDAKQGPKIVVATAGHINSGAFDDFSELSRLCQHHDAWLHVDGAFGLWARVLPEKDHLTQAIDLADSWSVDGHKWLQIPYDSGFAIVKDQQAHRKAMDISADYLNHSLADGRNPSEFNPELSRRARGFAAWAVMQAKGRQGIIETVRRHCECAAEFERSFRHDPRVQICNRVELNQLVMRVNDCDQKTAELADYLNASSATFVRTTIWKGDTMLRLSVIEKSTNRETMAELKQRVLSFLG